MQGRVSESPHAWRLAPHVFRPCEDNPVQQCALCLIHSHKQCTRTIVGMASMPYNTLEVAVWLDDEFVLPSCFRACCCGLCIARRATTQ